MKINALLIVAAVVLALSLALTGCMNSTTRNVNPSTTNSPDYMPGNNGNANGDVVPVNPTSPAATANNDGSTSGATSGALMPFDWANGAAQIEAAIARISEIAESRVVVTDSTALVGVKFDGVYKGQLTERLRQMIAAEVMKADPSIQTVAVTSEAGDVQKVYALSDQIRNGRTSDELSDSIHAIVRNATTMR